jgi:preprotein translocase subunit SecE
MAKITVQIPEPKDKYDAANQRQLNASLETLKNQLNFSFQEDLKQEIERVSWFNARY